MTKKKLILIIPLSVILILTVSFFVYAGIYYHADAAADYAAGNADKLDGVILLAAYPASKLDGRLKTVLIYGSEDKVLNAGRYEDNLKNTPDDRTEHIIQGGNHAQFGSYGEQKGDGTASITGKEQVDETVYVIIGTVLVK